MATRRSKRKSTANIACASEEDKQRIRDRRISRLDSDADDVGGADNDDDDDDDDFEARHDRVVLRRHGSNASFAQPSDA